MIIGISGKYGSGKDTVGNIIQYLLAMNNKEWKPGVWSKEAYISGNSNAIEYAKRLNKDWQIKKFADKAVKSFKIITDVDFHSLSKNEKEEVRPQFIKYAEGIKNIFGINVWVNALMNEYQPIDCECNGPGFCGSPGNCEELAIYPNFIITDLRFPNELKAIKDKGGITIRVNRKLDRVLTSEEINSEFHPSETALDDAEFNYVITNDGTIEVLIEKVKQILISEQIIS